MPASFFTLFSYYSLLICVWRRIPGIFRPFRRHPAIRLPRAGDGFPDFSSLSVANRLPARLAPATDSRNFLPFPSPPGSPLASHRRRIPGFFFPFRRRPAPRSPRAGDGFQEFSSLSVANRPSASLATATDFKNFLPFPSPTGSPLASRRRRIPGFFFPFRRQPAPHSPRAGDGFPDFSSLSIATWLPARLAPAMDFKNFLPFPSPPSSPLASRRRWIPGFFFPFRRQPAIHQPRAGDGFPDFSSLSVANRLSARLALATDSRIFLPFPSPPGHPPAWRRRRKQRILLISVAHKKKSEGNKVNPCFLRP